MRVCGECLLFIQPGESPDSKHVRLLTLLAILENYELAQIESECCKQFSESIVFCDILELAQKPAFIQPTDELHKSNPNYQAKQALL